MRAMVLTTRGARRLDAFERRVPTPAAGEVVIRVRACGVCRTDLHVVDGELPSTKIPIVPGHEVTGVVEIVGAGVGQFARGDRVGVSWLGFTCGQCDYCRSGRENLCATARFTGCQIDGGYAEYTCADARFVFKLPAEYDDVAAAPLLCAGLIGYRSYRMAAPAAMPGPPVRQPHRGGVPSRGLGIRGEASALVRAGPGSPTRHPRWGGGGGAPAPVPEDSQRLGLYGFGAAAHVIAQVAVHDRCEVYAFTSPGDEAAQQFARELGCVWAGGSTAAPPRPLDAAIIFAPVGRLVPEALSRVRPGGTVVCAGIHMSDIPSFPYQLLWQERVVRSVANLTRQDAREFLALAPRIPVRTHVRRYDLLDANAALEDLRAGRIEGAAVLVP